MKKLFLFAAAVTVMASCTNNEIVGDGAYTAKTGEGTAISFSGSSSALTRAEYTGADAADKLKNNFVVEGVKSNGTVATQEVVFDHYNVNWVTHTANTTTSNTNDWEYVAQTKHAYGPAGDQAIKYWDYSKSQYDFIAYSKGDATAVYADGDYNENANVLITEIDASKMNGTNDAGEVQTDVANITKGAYTIKGKASELAKVYISDLQTVYRDGASANDANGRYNNVVTLKFRSLSAKVRIALYETVPGYSVKNVMFYNADDDASPDATAKLFTTASSTDVFNEEGTYIVYYPTTGRSNYDANATDYNKAHLKFVPASGGTDTKKEFGALTGNLASGNFATSEGQEAAISGTDKGYLGRSSNTATYAGTYADNYYTVVIPNETGAVLNLKVNYTLVSTDGSGEVINVTGATAQVPAVYATWKSGYAYTYIFKISQNTNGLTNPDITGVVGLYPITFDAVVTETEEGVQETITTVHDPSITTYSKGVVVTANNEYKANKNIYVIVGNAATTLNASNAKMYKVTLADGAAQTINEASVANLLANGTNTSGTYTVTDANGKAMTASQVGISFPGKIAADDAPDGNEITVNCALFNTTTTGTYAFEYNDGTKKHYKIIKIIY